MSLPATGVRSSNQSSVVVSRLTKSFRRTNGETVVPVADASIEIAAGEMIVLLGPSGCGKTTLLRCIAGLEVPDTGVISIQGNVVFSSADGINVAPEHRRLGMVFQSYALWPHMSVFDNVAYPLRARRRKGPELKANVDKVLDLVDISALRDLRPDRLSGGQQQRVALARALSSGDNLILFDEPLSNVDAKVRESVRADLLTMQRSVGFAAVYVTHDQAEALELADRLVLLRAGRIVQVGTPREIYLKPNSHYVATFVGAANELVGEVSQIHGSEVVLRSRLGTIVGRTAQSTLKTGQRAVAVLRPELLSLSLTEPSGPNVWQGQIGACLYSGADCNYLIRAEDIQLRVRSPNPDFATIGQSVYIQARAEQSLIFEFEDKAGAQA
jgi:iron(III) transport system ATP-binding protein